MLIYRTLNNITKFSDRYMHIQKQSTVQSNVTLIYSVHRHKKNCNYNQTNQTVPQPKYYIVTTAPPTLPPPCLSWDFLADTVTVSSHLIISSTN